MNLLHVTPAYAPFVGGAENYIQTLSERWVAAGSSVTLLTTNAAEVEYFWNPHKRHVAAGEETLEGVRVLRCAVHHSPLAPWSFYLLRRLMNGVARFPWDTTSLLRRLAGQIPSIPDILPTLAALPGPFDLVHGINITLERPLLAAWRYARQRGIPFVVTPFVHVGPYGSFAPLPNYAMPHQLEILRDADAVIVQTDIEETALARLGVSQERLHRVGMGVNLSALQGGVAQRFRECYNLSGSIITFMGTVAYDKGVFHLIRALERLWQQGEAAHLVIAGAPVGAFERFYRRLSPATRSRIHCLGVVSGQPKLDLLAASDVLALPSRIDSFGIVFLEAWVYQKPVIGAWAAGTPGVIADGADGLLVQFGDVSGLAGAIQTLLHDAALAQRMGCQGHAKVMSRYTWDEIFRRLSQIYRQLATKEP